MVTTPWLLAQGAGTLENVRWRTTNAMPVKEKLRMQPAVASSTDYLHKLLNSYEAAQTGPAELQRDAKHVIAVWVDAIVEGEGTTEDKIQFLKNHLKSAKVSSQN